MNAVYIARSKAVAARVLDGEMMIMSAKDSTLFTLNLVGTLIWQAADGQTTLAEIVETKVCPEFDVEPDDAIKDAEAFVSDLASHGILHISGAPIDGGAR